MVGMTARKEDLMIVLCYFLPINVNELCYDGAILLCAVVIEIGNVTDYQVPMIFRNRIAYLEKPLDVFVMTGQFVKH